MSQSRLELVIDSRQAERELRQLQGRLDGVDRAGTQAQSSASGLSRELGGLKTVALAAGGAFAAMGISSLGRDVFNTVASVEKMRASLVTVTGSIDSANAAWDQMREFAKTTPFELDQSVKAFIRMKALGLDPTEDALRSFANTSAAMGTDLMQMVEAVADATTGEFERLKEYGIKASQDGEKVALTFQGTTTTIGNNAKEIQRYLENIGNTNFADAAIDQMDTLSGKANNLSDSVTDLYLAIGAAGATDVFNAALDGSAEAVEFLNNNVETLASGVDLLADAAIIAAGIYTGRFVSAMAAGTLAIGGKIVATYKDMRQTALANAEDQGRVLILSRRVAAEKAAAASSAQVALQRATQDKAAVAQDAQRLASTQAALAAERALETQRMQSQISAQGRMMAATRLAEIRASEIAIANQLTAANVRLTEAEVAETSAKRASTLATVESTKADATATAAKGTYAGAAAAATRANVLLAASARAASGALALVGGPVGALVIAGAAGYYFRDSLGFASEAARETKQEIDELTGSLENYTQAQYENSRVSIVQDLAEARIEASKLQEQIASLQEQSQQESIMYQGRPGASSGQLAGLMAELQEQNRIISANEDGLREYDQAWKDVLHSQISGVSIFRTLDQWLMDTGDSANNASTQFDALNYTLGTGGEKWDDYIGKLTSARDVLGMTAAEAANFAAVQQGFTGLYAEQAGAVAGQTAALEDYRSAIQEGNSVEAAAHLERAQRYAEAEAMVLAQLQNIDTLTNLLKGVQTELSATALSAALVVGGSAGNVSTMLANAVAAINERASAIQRTTTVTVKNTAANRAAEAAERERTRALDDSISAYADLFKELSPVGAAQAEYNETVARLTVAYDAGTKSAIEYYAAIGQAANIYNEAVRAADPNIKRVEELSNQYDRAYVRGQQLTTTIDDINAAYRRGDIDGQQYGRMIQGVRDEMAELALEADPVAQEMARAWEEASNRIDETFSDAFAGAFDSFDSFADNLLDGFKRLLAELAYQATLKPIVVGFTADMQSMMSGKSASSGGGFGGIGSLINSGKSLLGFGSTAAAPSLAMQGGLSSAALASASQVATGATYSGALGSAASGAALGNSAGLMSSITSGISAAMPWLAGGFAIDNILGLGITDGITKALSGLFGSDRKSYGQIGSQIGGDPNAGDGVYRYDRNDRSMGWAQQTALGTIGVTKKQKTDDDALIAMVDGLAQFDNTLASVMTAAQLEQTRTALDGWKSSRTENIGGLVDERLSAVLNATNSVFTDALSQFEGEALVQGLVGGLQVENVGAQMAAAVAADMNAEFREALGNGSDIQAATQSILSSAQAVQTLGGAVDRLNLQFDATAAGALSAAGNLANLVGGTDNLNSLLSGYYDAFYTEQEKFDDLASDLSATFAEMGRELPSTREGVRELVNGLQLMGSAGQEQLATVLKLTPALREYVTAMEEQRSSIEGVNRAALAQQMFMSSTTADVSNAIDAYNEQLAAIDDVAQARKDQLQQEMRAVEQLSGLIDSLMLSNQSILDPAERLQEAQRQFAELQVRAEGGDMGAISQLQGASSSYLDAAAAYYGQSSSQYADIFGDVNDGISDLERSFGDSLDSLGSIESIEERALQEQKRALSVLESSLRSEIDQVQSLNNMTDLLGALPSELASILAGLLAKPAGGGGGGGPVTSADIQNSVGSVTGAGGFISDSGARDLYNSALENGVSLSEVQKYLPPGNDAVAWAERNGLPVFADGAAFTNGVFDRPTAFPMGLMGEAGSEAIMPLANIGGGLGVNVAGAVDLEPLTRELAALRAEVAMLRAERRNDASVAADQRSKQLGEQKKINKNVKLKERVS